MHHYMSHRVPDLDVGSHSLYWPPGKGEAVAAPSDPFCDEGEENYVNSKKHAGSCVPDNQVSWMETETEEKRARAFAVGRESALAIDVPLGHLPFQEDEMLSWLQYPLDDTFSKSYCSEQLCEQPLTAYPAQGLIPGSISMDSEKLSSTSFSSQLLKPSDSGMGVQTLTSDTAMAMGAQRAAGLRPQAGAEAFNRVHRTRKSSHDASPSKASEIMHTPHNVVDNHAGKQNAKNFSFFSQRVAAMKTSLQIRGPSSGPSNKERLKQPFNTQASEISSSVEQSTGMASLTSSSPLGESYLSEPGKEVMQGTDTIVQQKISDPMHCADKVGKANIEINAWGAAVGSEILETGDVTLTSLSDGSDYSTEKSAKEMVDLSCKRKSFPAEESECDSKDARGVASLEKGPTPNRSNSAKRTRAAEIHNQSERRRRNKINEKMRALQELIPNANKTDKASMLDEAIEYVKMLQAQLQLMSVRTGMIVPPVMMPPGMQYLSVQQRQGSSQMTMGMGASRGFVMDASRGGVGALPRPAFLGQPVPGHVYHLAGYHPNGSPSVMHEVQSPMNLNDRHTVSAFQQLQPLHSPRAANMHKSRMQAKSDSRKQH